MNNAAIYVMPGTAAAAAPGGTQLFMLDLRPASKFNKEELSYVRAIASQKWTTLHVADPIFN